MGEQQKESWKNILKGELIGLRIKVIKSDNPVLVGIKGKIIDETRNMLVVEQENKKMSRLIKDKITLHVYQNNRIIEIDGKLLIGRPEDRVKKIKSY